MKIDKNEVLRYLGYNNQAISHNLNEKIDFLIENAYKIITPKAVWGVFEPEFGEGIALKGTAVKFFGQDIQKHLFGAKKIAVLAVTLGIAAEREILRYQQTDMVSAVICDSVFDSYIEAAADSTEAEIVDFAKKEGLYTNYRYSPGYGDFPLSVQKEIISALSCQKRIGLTVTESDILLPRKSITAVMGLFGEKQEKSVNRCETCNMKDKCKSKRECVKNV